MFHLKVIKEGYWKFHVEGEGGRGGGLISKKGRMNQNWNFQRELREGLRPNAPLRYRYGYSLEHISNGKYILFTGFSYDPGEKQKLLPVLNCYLKHKFTTLGFYCSVIYG